MKSLVHRPQTPWRAAMATKKEMAQLSAETIKMLIDQSHEVKKQSHCPYSKFRVGSALLTVDNRVITGKGNQLNPINPPNLIRKWII